MELIYAILIYCVFVMVFVVGNKYIDKVIDRYEDRKWSKICRKIDREERGELLTKRYS